jgi:hypothetical protein
MATSFSGGRSRSTRREPPTMDTQLVNFITCDCESSEPFFVIYKAVLVIGLYESLQCVLQTVISLRDHVLNIPSQYDSSFIELKHCNKKIFINFNSRRLITVCKTHCKVQRNMSIRLFESSDHAKYYVQFRPDYPDSVVRTMVEYYASNNTDTTVDSVSTSR